MHLWLYSSGGFLNEEMDLAMIRYFNHDNPRLTFVASCYESADYYFEEFSERFGRFGFTNLHLLHLDRQVSASKIERALSSDLIYLSGGNTFYFLDSMHRTKFLPKLHEFVEKGGILAGNSAGAIIMTPEISTASYPEDDRDENDVGLEDWDALGLVNFEYYPHYDHSRYYKRVLTRASMESPHVIYAVTDGSGICINGPAISFFGEVYAYYNGECFQVSGA